jgi:hypothetical protein
MLEVCFLIGEDGEVLWSDVGEGPLAIADSAARWHAIWSRRDQLAEIAHSHPLGPLEFSHEDETTMKALTLALGRALRFSVVAPNGMIRRIGGETMRVVDEPGWAERLRRESNME